MVIGSFGQIVFEVSNKVARSFDGFEHSHEARLGSTEIIAKEPLTEFLGPGSQGVSFTLRLAAALGVDPQAEYDKFGAMCRAGQAATLVLGGKPYGGSGARWIIGGLSASYTQWSQSGKPIWIDVQVSLKKYVVVAK